MATLDKSQDFGFCFGGDAHFIQNGLFFDGNGNEIVTPNNLDESAAPANSTEPATAAVKLDAAIAVEVKEEAAAKAAAIKFDAAVAAEAEAAALKEKDKPKRSTLTIGKV